MSKANGTFSPHIAALQAGASARAEGLKVMANLLAEQLSNVMEEIHGGTWRVVVDHGRDSRFALVRQDNVTPKNRAA